MHDYQCRCLPTLPVNKKHTSVYVLYGLLPPTCSRLSSNSPGSHSNGCHSGVVTSPFTSLTRQRGVGANEKGQIAPKGRPVRSSRGPGDLALTRYLDKSCSFPPEGRPEL